VVENMGAASLEIDPSGVARLDAIIKERTVVGRRYNEATQAEIDTENF
jgi:hypothetical protein